MAQSMPPNSPIGNKQTLTDGAVRWTVKAIHRVHLR